MKKPIILTLMALLAGFLLLACRAAAPSEPPTATPNVAAIVEAAVQATAVAEAQLQQLIDTAVETAVTEAVDPAVEAAVQATFDTYAAQSEEALAAAIETAMTEAVVATESYASVTTEAGADGAVTTEEVQTIEVYVSGAEAAVDEVETLLATYDELYGDLTQQAVNELGAIEAELADLNNSIDTMNETLEEINQTLEAGLELADETIATLQSTADAATASVQTIQTEAKNWSQTVQHEVENRAAQLQAIQPTTVAANPQEAMQQVTQYIDAVKTASLDQILSQGELSQIAQLGANATAGLNAQGIPQLAQLSGAINQVTQQLGRGDLGQAGQDLGNLQNNLLNSGLDLGQLGNLSSRSAVDGGTLGEGLNPSGGKLDLGGAADLRGGERPGRP